MDHPRHSPHNRTGVEPFFGLKGGYVQLPRWILFVRALQLLFAIIIVGLVSYSFSVHDGGYIRPALIPTLIIAILTILLILPLTTVLAPSFRRLYDPRVALLADGIATLFWLASFTALACYERIYYNAYGFGDYYRKRDLGHDDKYEAYVRYEEVRLGKAKRAWKTGAAAAWFGGIEFLLFSVTTLVFVYHYHHYLAGTTTSGLTSTRAGDAEASPAPSAAAPGIAAPADAAVATAAATHTATTASPEQENTETEKVPEITEEKPEGAGPPYPVDSPYPVHDGPAAAPKEG